MRISYSLSLFFILFGSLNILWFGLRFRFRIQFFGLEFAWSFLANFICFKVGWFSIPILYSLQLIGTWCVIKIISQIIIFSQQYSIVLPHLFCDLHLCLFTSSSFLSNSLFNFFFGFSYPYLSDFNHIIKFISNSFELSLWLFNLVS